MCGISGYYSFQEEVSSKNILEMNKTIQHRGLDDEGFWLNNDNNGFSYSGKDSLGHIKTKFPLLQNDKKSKIAVGFRRLAIVDLSEKGHQPMLSESEKLIITFNGEIYNFKTLRKELEENNYHFDTQSDTEVLLKAYQHWDTEVFTKLDGMFALCIIDLEKNKLILGRDRLGLKPLFYHQSETQLTWASEIKAILKTDWVTPAINWQGVYTNFLFQTTLAPNTCFKDIYSLEAASFMSVNLDNFEITHTRYWHFPKRTQNVTEKEAIQKTEQLLSQSIQEQLFADVPVASMMSGGIDSTLVTALSKPYKNDINAFTIAYQFSEEEVEKASLMATKIDVPHHIKEVDDQEILSQLIDNIQHFEEPYSGLEVLLNAAEFAQKEGFKVVLSGNGADELFGGYAHSLKLNKWLKLKNFNFVRNFIFTNDGFSQRVKNYFSQDNMLDFFRQSQFGMRPQQAKNLFSKEILKDINPDLQTYHLSNSKDYKGLFEYDMRYSLSSHHVFRDDISAMKYGVEFRYPYLSNALVDYISSLPENIRYNGIQNKPLLRKIASQYLPSEVLKMPKRGFSFPLAHFIKTNKAANQLVAENLESLKSRGFFDPKLIDDWWDNLCEDYDYVKIWQLVTFELWYQKYFENQ